MDIAEKIHGVFRILLFVLATTPVYAYLTFYLVYPVVCILPVGAYPYTYLLYVFYAILIGVFLGILIESLQEIFLVIIISSFLGYILAIIYQAFPYFLYGYALYISDIVIMRFIEYSWLVFIIYPMMGIIGGLMGGYIRDKLEG